MSKVLVSESNLQDIADAIREKNGSSDTYTPGEMSTAIENIPSGGGDVSEYFNDTISANTTSNSTILMKSIKKLPSITILSNITSLSYAFYQFNASQIPQLNILSNRITNFLSMFQECKNITSIPQLDTSSGTSFASMFYSCTNLTSIPQLDTSKGTSFNSMFYSCTNLTSIPQLDTSSGTNFGSMFYSCTNLTSIPQLDTSSGTSFSNMFAYCDNLENIPLIDLSKATIVSSILSVWNDLKLTSLGGFKNLGQAYLTTQNANYSNYTLDLSQRKKLTHDSLMNVINNLYDIATKGCNAQKLVLGSTNMAKLTAEEIAIATNKGWTVS